MDWLIADSTTLQAPTMLKRHDFDMIYDLNIVNSNDAMMGARQHGWDEHNATWFPSS